MNYIKIYNDITERARNEYLIGKRIKNKGIYYEGHHIIPKCLGGTGDSWKWDHENIVPLTAREHFLCHWLLHECYPNNLKLSQAFHSMCKIKNNLTKDRYTPSSRIYEYAKKLKSKIGFPEESRKKGVQTRKINGSYKPTEDQIQKGLHTKILNGTINHTKNHIENITISLKKLNQKKVICDHCGKTGFISGMKAWHFDNCRLLKK
jgi:hypothetical protein